MRSDWSTVNDLGESDARGEGDNETHLGEIWEPRKPVGAFIRRTSVEASKSGDMSIWDNVSVKLDQAADPT